jgi:hypothetical protein
MVEEGDLERGEIVEQYPTVDGTVVERTPLDGGVAGSEATETPEQRAGRSVATTRE